MWLSQGLRGHDKHLFAVEVGLNRRVRPRSARHVAKQGVGVAADDEVNACRVLGHRNVDVVPDVGHSNNALDVFVLVDIVSPVLDGLNGVGERCRIVRVGDGRDRVGRDCDDRELVLGEDMIWLDRRVDVLVLAVHIRTDNGDSEVVELSGEV